MTETFYTHTHTNLCPGPGDFIDEFYHIIKDEKSIFHKIFQKIAEGTLLNSFYEASIFLIPKPYKDIMRKANCKPMSHKTWITGIFSKIPATQIWQYIKKNYISSPSKIYPRDASTVWHPESSNRVKVKSMLLSQ